jgi:hypothetical protein
MTVGAGITATDQALIVAATMMRAGYHDVIRASDFIFRIEAVRSMQNDGPG